jgi:hypothetical protein
MGRIRAFRLDDIPDMVRLRRRIFRVTERPSDDSLAAYYQQVFFENPWRDDAIQSLLYENGRGQPSGFIGVIPRPMVFQGEPVRAAVGTEFMVDPGERGAAGIQLLERCLQGPQDLSIADRANDSARALWECLGGATALWYSLYWSLQLRPAGYLVCRLESRVPRRVGLMLRPVAGVLDACARRVVRSGRSYRQVPAGIAEPLEVDTLVNELRRVDRRRLLPGYDKESVRWLLERLEERVTCGTLERAQIRDPHEGVVGWFLYFLSPDRCADVVQLAAAARYRGQVFDHLLHHAWQRGAVHVSGRLDAPFIGSVLERGYTFRLARPWTMMHSRRPELMALFQGGGVFLSRMEAEWWMGF